MSQRHVKDIRRRNLASASLIFCLLFASAIAGLNCTPAYAALQKAVKTAHNPQDYANAYKSLMLEYRAKMVALSSRPLPSKSLPKPVRRAKLADAMEDVARATDGFAHRIDTLKPPPPMREVHIATRAFFQSSADDNRHLAAAIRSGKRADVAKAITQSEQDEAAGMKHIADVVQRAGNAEGVGGAVHGMLKERGLAQ